MSDYVTRNMALEEYSKMVPPGWAPHDHTYTLRQYKERLELWGQYRNTPGAEMPSNEMGPAIVGRLKGSAYRLANKIQIKIADDPRIDVALRGRTLVGAEAICFPGMVGDTTVDPPVPHVASGIKHIMQILEDAFGADAADQLAVVLNRFFNLKRANGNLMDFCIAFTLRYDAAHEQAGLEIGDVGLTHLFLTGAGLARRFIDDILLKVDGDRTKFKKIHEIVS